MIQEKYIELLLKRCLKVDNQPLFVSYNIIDKQFINKLIDYAKSLGIKDIYLDERNLEYEKEFINKNTIEEIKKSKYFECQIWDEYAKKNAAFLLFDSYIPGLMDDIDSEKLAKVSYIKQTTKPIYKEGQLKGTIGWCISIIPNELWAKEIFPKSDQPLEKFWNVLAEICMLNTENAISSWNKFLKEQSSYVKKLNKLKIRKLIFKNQLGTHLSIELANSALWQSASDGKWLVNMPSYEIFTTPNYKKTNGIVYNSKPLVYNGKVIDKFWIKFKDGKVIDYQAKIGEDVLTSLINTDELSSYLGEVAIVNFDSPISNTNTVFKTTLLDENASCHLALGSGFLECLENGNSLNKDELSHLGFNCSKNHVDFMIGTSDLTIEAETCDGYSIIMENGNLVI